VLGRSWHLGPVLGPLAAEAVATAYAALLWWHWRAAVQRSDAAAASPPAGAAVRVLNAQAGTQDPDPMPYHAKTVEAWPEPAALPTSSLPTRRGQWQSRTRAPAEPRSPCSECDDRLGTNSRSSLALANMSGWFQDGYLDLCRTCISSCSSPSAQPERARSSSAQSRSPARPPGAQNTRICSGRGCGSGAQATGLAREIATLWPSTTAAMSWPRRRGRLGQQRRRPPVGSGGLSVRRLTRRYRRR
jgi:hypothetical protein